MEFRNLQEKLDKSDFFFAKEVDRFTGYSLDYFYQFCLGFQPMKIQRVLQTLNGHLESINSRVS